MHKTIAILPGDGIGPEIMEQALRLLPIIEQQFGHQFILDYQLIGGAAYDVYQCHLPQKTLNACLKADAILMGSIGGPVNERHLAKWRNCEANSLLSLRKALGTSINIRPLYLPAEIAHLSPLKNEIVQQGIDLLIYRELTGGIYFGRHDRYREDGIDTAEDQCLYHANTIHSIAKAAFVAAESRSKNLCLVDKANVLSSSQLWREVVDDVSGAFPKVKVQKQYIDNCAMQMVQNPCQYDVILTENMFGDILSDLAAGIGGSIGMLPSASLSPDQKGLYEPIGGSAPELSGKNIANPSAQILSLAMLLRHSFKLDKEADHIESAVYSCLKEGKVTADLCKNQRGLSSSEFTDAVISYC